MADEMKIDPTKSAKEVYEHMKQTFNVMPLYDGELTANIILKDICERFAENYEQIIVDQNEYEVDIEENIEEIENLEEDIQAKIKKLEAEIAELNKKKENGTITKEEEALLASKNTELEGLYAKSKNEVNEHQEEIDEKVKNAENSEHKTKAQIATDFGELAIEKGEPLTQVQDKRKSFWRKLFNTWDKSGTREFGQEMVDAGNNLLDKVAIASESTEKIKALKNKSATK